MKPANFHPGQFPFGSPISRAAARSLVEERRAHARLAELVIRVDSSEAPSFSEWKDNEDGSFTRFSRIPRGMAFEDAEKAAGLVPIAPKGEYHRISFDRDGSF